MVSNNFKIPEDPKFSVKLKELRNKNGLSIRELSMITGLSRSTISEIESRKYDNPTCITLIKLTKGLNCKLEELVNIN